MKKDSFSLFGDDATFKSQVPVGQLYFPSWERYEAAMRGIFERRYYTNQGPLVQELELKLEEYLEVKHVVCVTNATIGLMMAAEAMNLSGKVIMPSFTFIASAQSLSWVGIKPVFCDVNPLTHQMDIDQLDSLIDEDVTGIMGVNLWGGVCDPVRLEMYAEERNLKLYFDSAHAFGCMVGNKKVANFGSVEVFSFHATKVLSATEGGCLCTNDDELAAKLRNIRSSYGAGKSVAVVKTSNGRMSEAQAAIALMSLEDFSQNQNKNETLFHVYKEKLKVIPGIKMLTPAGVTFSNYQYVVCEIDESVFGLSRDELITVLKAENVAARRYFYPAAHRNVEFIGNSNANALPITEQLCATCIQFPIGDMTDRKIVETICELLDRVHRNAGELKQFLVGSDK